MPLRGQWQQWPSCPMFRLVRTYTISTTVLLILYPVIRIQCTNVLSLIQGSEKKHTPVKNDIFPLPTLIFYLIRPLFPINLNLLRSVFNFSFFDLFFSFAVSLLSFSLFQPPPPKKYLVQYLPYHCSGRLVHCLTPFILTSFPREISERKK